MGRDKRDTGSTSRRGRHCNSEQNSKMVGSLEGKRETLVEHYHKLGTPAANERFDAEFEEEISAWAQANIGASEKEDSGSDGL